MINLDKFFKVFGDEGTEYFPIDSDPYELYTGMEILRVSEVEGYGVPVTEQEFKVFKDPSDAEDFYNQLMGGVTSSNLVFDPNGIRERIEYNAFKGI
jgi:hypothetical protein